MRLLQMDRLFIFDDSFFFLFQIFVNVTSSNHFCISHTQFTVHSFEFISTVSHSLVIGALHLGGGGGDGGTSSSIVHTRSSIGNLKLISLPLIVSISKLFSPASINHQFVVYLIDGWMNTQKEEKKRVEKEEKIAH